MYSRLICRRLSSAAHAAQNRAMQDLFTTFVTQQKAFPNKLVLSEATRVLAASISEPTNKSSEKNAFAQADNQSGKNAQANKNRDLNAKQEQPSFSPPRPPSRDTKVNDKRILQHLRYDGHVEHALDIYKQVTNNGRLTNVISDETLAKLIEKAGTVDFVASYNMLQLYKQQTRLEIKDCANLYRLVCAHVANIGQNRLEAATLDAIESCLYRLKAELHKLDDDDSKHLCFLQLLISLLQQKVPRFRQFTRPVYEHVYKHGYLNNKPRVLERLLLDIKIHLVNELPYDEILHELVTRHATFDVEPPIVYNYLYGLAPFTKTKKTTSVLRSIITLQKRGNINNNSNSNTNHDAQDDNSDQLDERFLLDIGVIEQIAVAAASHTDLDLIIAVWDVMEQQKLMPTEIILESAICLFVAKSISTDNDDQNLLTQALIFFENMGTYGCEPSRALISELSLKLCSTRQTMDNFLQLASGSQLRNEEGKISTNLLNLMLLTCAERGDINYSRDLFQIFATECGVKINIDTISYALKTVGKHAAYLTKTHGSIRPKVAAFLMTHAEDLLVLMEKENLDANHDVVHNYVELLCKVDDLDTAIQTAYTFHESGVALLSKTVYRLVIMCLEVDRMDTAEELALWDNEVNEMIALQRARNGKPWRGKLGNVKTT